MATAKIQAPDGKIITLEVPDGATEQQIMEFVQANYKPEKASEITANPETGSPMPDVQPDLAPTTPEAPAEPSFMDRQMAGRENMMAMGSAAIVEPLAGLIGIAQAVNPFADEGAGARAVEATRQALTYQPRSDLAKQGQKDMGEKLGFIGDVISNAPGDFMFNLAKDPNFMAATKGNPILAPIAENPAIAGTAGAIAIPAALELLGVKGIKNIKTAKDARRVVANEIKAGNRNIENITKILDSNGKLLDNPMLRKSIDMLGDTDEARHTAMLFDTMNKQTKSQVNRMLDTIQSGRDKGLLEIQKNRPVNVIGDSLAKRIQAADRIRKTAGKELDSAISKDLKGVQVDISKPVNEFVSSLESKGIKVFGNDSGKLSVNLDNATVKLGDTLPKAELERILNMVDSGVMTGAKAHEFKRFIREFVDYPDGGMQVGTKTSKAVEDAIKDLSSGINNSLGEISPAYAKANAKYASVVDSLSQASKQLKDFDINSDMASAKLGNLSKRIASNLTSKEQIQALIDNLDDSLSKNGVKFKDDINAQVAAVSQIEKIFKLEGQQSPFGLQGRLESAGNVVGGGGIQGEGIRMALDKLKKMSEPDFNAKMAALRKLSEVKKP